MTSTAQYRKVRQGLLDKIRIASQGYEPTTMEAFPNDATRDQRLDVLCDCVDIINVELDRFQPSEQSLIVPPPPTN